MHKSSAKCIQYAFAIFFIHYYQEKTMCMVHDKYAIVKELLLWTLFYCICNSIHFQVLTLLYVMKVTCWRMRIQHYPNVWTGLRHYAELCWLVHHCKTIWRNVSLLALCRGHIHYWLKYEMAPHIRWRPSLQSSVFGKIRFIHISYVFMSLHVCVLHIPELNNHHS